MVVCVGHCNEMGLRLIVLIYLASSVASLQGPQVTIDQGTLRGRYLKSANGNTYAAFQGIPYAKPPVGELRFKEPQPALPWSGIWHAESTSNDCVQLIHRNVVTGEEDCLYLNVYTPADAAECKLDVLINIHGGAFMFGSADSYGPKYLLDRDVIVVSMNYRLGPLGFFSTGDEVVPGNNGLKDQSLALRWVQKNIAAFGGNPDRVTITGASAGGASVHLHYLSSMSKGLFHQGISLSGTALCPWTQAEDLKQKGEKLGDLLGCPTQNSRDLINCLRQRPARAILEHVKSFKVWLGVPFSPFGPTVEVARPGAFLTEQPIDIIVAGRSQDLPWITGVTTGEGLYPAADFVMSAEKTSELAERWDEILPFLLDFNATVAPGQHSEVAQRIKKFYLGDKPVTREASVEIVQMIGDRLFVADAQLTAQLHAKHTTAPVYFYQFAYRGKHSLSEYLTQSTENIGSSHADDTAFVYETDYNKIDETKPDKAMSMLMIDWWMHFINTGNPSPPNVTWEPLVSGEKEISYLYLGSSNNVEIRTCSDLGNRHFWDSLPIREAQIDYSAANKHRSKDEL